LAVVAIAEQASVAVAADVAAVDILPGVCEQQRGSVVDSGVMAAVVTTPHPEPVHVHAHPETVHADIGASRPRECPGMNPGAQQQQPDPVTPPARTACTIRQPRRDAPSLDRTNLRFDASKYAEACALAGRTPDLDAFAEPDGSNALTDSWCSGISFLQHN
jgi:hypothetical protein